MPGDPPCSFTVPCRRSGFPLPLLLSPLKKDKTKGKTKKKCILRTGRARPLLSPSLSLSPRFLRPFGEGRPAHGGTSGVCVPGQPTNFMHLRVRVDMCPRPLVS